MVLISIVACGSKQPLVRPDPPPLPTVDVAPPPPSPPPPPEAVAPPLSETEDDIFARKTLEQLNAEKHLTPVFFALDSASISPSELDVMHKNAEWLKRWPSIRVTIEGHCDARGTAEYNLALGDRRAQSVRRYLTSLGIAPDRLLPVSKGKEQPICRTSSETCWQQNRRAHFIITAK